MYSDESAKSESTHRHSTLAAAYVAALAEAGAVGKDKTNAHHAYGYASAEAIIAAAREPLAAHGLGLLPTEFAIEANEKGEPAGIKREFVLVHESGEKQILSIAWPVVIERGRPADKAVAIADTASLKFLLRGLLLLPRVDATEEMDARRDSAPAARLSSGASGASAGNGHSGEARDARDDEPETPAPEIRAVGEWPGLEDALLPRVDATEEMDARRDSAPAARLSSGASGASAGNGHSGEARDARDDEPETPAPEIRAVGEWPGLEDALSPEQKAKMVAKFPDGCTQKVAEAAIKRAKATASATPKADAQRLPA